MQCGRRSCDVFIELEAMQGGTWSMLKNWGRSPFSMVTNYVVSKKFHVLEDSTARGWLYGTLWMDDLP